MDILIVEDDYISRNMLKKIISGMGHNIVEAEDGQLAWDLLQRRIIQVIITDWMMPGMDGLQLCRNIREAPFDRYVYIIVLTAKDRKADLVEVFQSGADDYIPKPFDPEELKARVLTGLRVIDLEERHRRMQGTLVESRNKLRIVIDALEEEIFAIDRDFIVHTANSAMCKKIEIKPDEIIGKKCCESRRYKVDHLKSCVDEVFEKGIVQSMMHTNQDKNGLTIYQQISCLPVKNETNEVVQVVVVSNDVSEIYRKKEEIDALNRRLMESTEQLEAKNRKLESALKQLQTTQSQMMHSEKMASIGQLAAGVAHEINNPTGFVSSNLKTLNDYKKDLSGLIRKYHEFMETLEQSDINASISNEINQYINKLRQYEKEIDIDYIMADIGDLINDCNDGTERIKKIVTDLKDFAHPGEDKIKCVDVNQGLRSTLNVVNNEIKYKAVVETEYGDISTVKGYPQQLNQVFMNILVNAAQAIDKEGHIFIKTATVDDKVEVVIRDTGCGIAPEDLSKIFDPFFTTKEVGKGTGLGMNIAYNIIQKHNGTIDVQSEVGKGTTFTILLPADREAMEE